VSFSPDGRLVLTASGDNLARLWQVDTGTLLHRIVGHTQAVRDAEFSRSGGLVVTASDDHDARIVVTATGRLAHVLRGHFTAVQTASFSPDGRWVVTAAALSGGLWQTATGRLFAPTGLVADPFLRGADGALTGASFGPDGRHIVTSSIDGTVRIFDCAVCGTLPDLTRVARSRLEHVRGRA
jgi:WD40 repeat protein